MGSIKRRIWFKLALTLLVIVLILAAAAGILFHWAVYQNNVALDDEQPGYLFINTGSGYNDLVKNIRNSGLLLNVETFEWVAKRKNLPNHVYPGRYELRHGMSNDHIVDMLRSGAQKPLNVIFNNIRTPEQLAGVISRQLEADSASIYHLFKDEEFLAGFGLTEETAAALFIPNTYEFYWNTDAKAFFNRMHREYNRFWNDERKNKALQLGYTPLQITIIASIVDRETNKVDEMPRIAGVYLNRLRKNWKLQADPTTVYAVYRETGVILNRVLRVHTQLDSPYNTYVYPGLPPGPISVPSIAAVDAVLNHEKHDYMFFVADADFSGYHRFSTNYNQHLRYAREYQTKLNQLNRE